MWITQSYLQIHHICLSFVYAFARGRIAANSFTQLAADILLIPRPTEGRRLSWPSWLTRSGRLAHEVVTRQLWIRRRSGKVRRLQTDVLTTEPHHQPSLSSTNTVSNYVSTAFPGIMVDRPVCETQTRYTCS